jgi:hypothetical protein
MSMSTTPSRSEPSPMTSGGPRPIHEVPAVEFSGLDRSMHERTNR